MNTDNKDKPLKSDVLGTFDDDYLEANIVEARDNHEKACEIYQNYVGSSETLEERKRRINRFRCGGW